MQYQVSIVTFATLEVDVRRLGRGLEPGEIALAAVQGRSSKSRPSSTSRKILREAVEVHTQP